MRTWAAGQAWWQGDAGPVLGPQRGRSASPRSARMPGCRRCRTAAAILSHDQVEAALLRAAGWGVAVLGRRGRLAARRIRRPCRSSCAATRAGSRGNLQYRHLLLRPGLLPMGRWQLVQAMLLFAGAPFYTSPCWRSRRSAGAGGGACRAAGRAAALAARLGARDLCARSCWATREVMLGAGRARALRRRRGGSSLGAACGDRLFTLLLDPIVAGLASTLAMLRLGAAARPAGRRRTAPRRGVGLGGGGAPVLAAHAARLGAVRGPRRRARGARRCGCCRSSAGCRSRSRSPC